MGFTYILVLTGAAVCDRIKGQVSARSGHTHHISRGKREHANMSVNLIRDGWGWMDGLLNPYEVHHVYKVRPLDKVRPQLCIPHNTHL